ncbi:AIG2-like protein [Nemania sp. FL0916]|nr:AIG2-like protein [Nemania sp. FL0916]
MADGKSKTPNISEPIFLYGTLCSVPLLAWALTGDSSKVYDVARLLQPAKVYGYARVAVKHGDYPAAIKHEQDSEIDGFLLTPETTSQRKKLDDFEGEAYKAESVTVTVLDSNGAHQTPIGFVEADIYLWAESMDELTDEPWELATFEKERLKDWLDLFEGIELVGEDEETEADHLGNSVNSTLE